MYNKNMAMDRKKKIGMKKFKAGKEWNKQEKKHNVVKGDYLEGVDEGKKKSCLNVIYLCAHICVLGGNWSSGMFCRTSHTRTYHFQSS